MLFSRLSFMLVCIAWTLPAQVMPLASRHIVSGVVFDSIARTPLSGAVVQAALIDSARAPRVDSALPRVFWAVTDSVGRYRMADLPAGRFMIGFQHQALSAVGLESPVNSFVLAADTNVALDLAIPSGAIVRARVCTPSPDGTVRDGALAGFLLDAQHGATLPDATVTISWAELGIARKRVTSVPHNIVATVSDAGAYLACNITSDGPVTIAVSRPGYRKIEGELTIPPGSVGRLDIRLSDTSVVRGTAALAGVVNDDEGLNIATGIVAIPAIGLQAPIENSHFSLTGVPVGTWSLETRAIGYEPRLTLVEIAERANPTLHVAIEKKVQTLEAMNVVGKPGRDMKILTQVQERMRTAHGTAILAGNAYLDDAIQTTDAIRGAVGFLVQSPTKVLGRLDGKNGSRCARVAVYLDGDRLPVGPMGLEMANNMLPVKQVLAVEAYPDMTTAPFVWQTHDACAVVAIWSKR
ncbi:MAG: carboxypeptidase-like regulatory domain-containing protein [bacterium]